MTLPPEAPDLDAGGGVALRALRPGDAEDLRALYADPLVARYSLVPQPYLLRHAEAFVAASARGWAGGTAATWAVGVGGRCSGTVDLVLTQGGWADLGYSLAPWARGRGAATRAVARALAWGFDELGLAGVHWRAEVGNAASRRVAERCGVTVEGAVRGLLLDPSGRRADGWVGSLLAADPRGPAAGRAAGPAAGPGARATAPTLEG